MRKDVVSRTLQQHLLVVDNAGDRCGYGGTYWATEFVRCCAQGLSKRRSGPRAGRAMALVKAKDLEHYISRTVSSLGWWGPLVFRFLVRREAWLLCQLLDFCSCTV